MGCASKPSSDCQLLKAGREGGSGIALDGDR